MPPQQSLPQAQRRAHVIAVILSLSEVILLYSCYIKKGLVYITIMAPSNHQPSSYSKCTSINIQSSYNICSVSNVKYLFFHLILAMSQLLGKNI